MGRDPAERTAPDLFPTTTGSVSSAPKATTETPPQRHILSKDLPNAIKHLSDAALDFQALELFSDGDPAATARFEKAFATGTPVPFDITMECGGKVCPWLASVTFGGSDLRTVYLGGLRADRIPFFTSPVAGLPMSHW